MIDSWLSQHYCLVSLAAGACFGVWGHSEYSGKDPKAAYLSWLWGGIVATPGVICALSRYPVRFLALIALLTIAIALWRQSLPADGSGSSQ